MRGTSIFLKCTKKMLLILLLVFSFQTLAKPIHFVTKNYNGPQSGWITINLDRHILGTKFARVVRVDWCGSIEPNPPPESKLVIRELIACSDPGLRHVKLYGGKNSLITNTESDPNMVYIDPKHVGGWDSNHQAQIVVRAEFDGNDGRKHELVQTYRFNPLYKNAPEITETTQVETKPPPPPPPVPTEEEVETTETKLLLTTPPVADAVSVSWSGMGSVLGIGLIMLVFVAVVAQRKKTSMSFPDWNKQPKLTLRPPSDDLDMESFAMIDHEEEPEDDDNQINLQFLMELGATPVYMDNY